MTNSRAVDYLWTSGIAWAIQKGRDLVLHPRSKPPPEPCAQVRILPGALPIKALTCINVGEGLLCACQNAHGHIYRFPLAATTPLTWPFTGLGDAGRAGRVEPRRCLAGHTRDEGAKLSTPTPLPAEPCARDLQVFQSDRGAGRERNKAVVAVPFLPRPTPKATE
jgi:hypothetical protein